MSTEMALQAAFLVWLITILAGGLGWFACDGLAWCVRKIRARRASATSRIVAWRMNNCTPA